MNRFHVAFSGIAGLSAIGCLAVYMGFNSGIISGVFLGIGTAIGYAFGAKPSNSG